MSAFVVSVTPTRVKNGRKSTLVREPTQVVLGLFSGKSIVVFEDVPVTKTARRILNVQNPTDDALTVYVTKSINPEAKAILEWTEKQIPANGCVEMKIIWTPTAVWSTKETIQFTDNRKFKKDVGVILKSIDKTQTKTGLKKMMSGRLPKENRLVTTKLTLKSPSPRTKQRMKLFRANEKRKATGTLPEAAVNKPPTMLNRKVLGVQNQIEIKNGTDNFDGLSLGNEKENQCPSTPINVSNIFDTFKLTPGNKTDNRSAVDFLASLPTPNAKSPSNRLSAPNVFDFTVSPTTVNDIFESSNAFTLNSTTTIETNVNIYDQTTSLYNLRTPNNRIETNTISNFEETVDYTNYALQQTPLGPNHASRMALFSLNETETIETRVVVDTLTVSHSPANRTQILSSPVLHLSVIEEETSNIDFSETFIKVQNEHQRTYSVVQTPSPANLHRDIQLSGTPLQKKFQSMKELSEVNGNLEQQCLKSNQGSMPNLSKIEKLSSIENNRYFYQSIEKDLQMRITEEPEQKSEGDLGNFSNNECDGDNLGDSICSNKSTMSTLSTVFKENEILAQSSQFNLHELGRSSIAANTKPMFYFVDSHGPQSNATKKKSDIVKPQLSASSPLLNRDVNTTDKLTKSTRDIRANKSIASNRPSVISYARKTSISTTPNHKRNREDSLDNSKRFAKSFSEPESPQPAKGQAYRTNTWGGTMPKKFKVPNVPQQRLIFKRSSDERIILFDPELHIKAVINPDPFAATTTIDPFLSATMYLDEQAIERHEIQFKKWLNALVTIPEDIAETTQKIDYGKLFNEVRNKDINLAPTKEIVSANYLTKSRIDSLRSAAISLYMSDEMRESLEKLMVHIEKKSLQIRQDRNLHLDVVLQRQILELLLNFNPIWLRIGLEVVFGEIIPMHNNQDVLSLSAFILNRLFRDRYLEAKHPRVYAHGNAYAEHIKKFTLKRFLCLIYFLDVAKKRRIIKHNPCLFLKTSEFKETKEILLRFSSSLLGNIGDIGRELRRIGIILTHKQTYIDEFDYAFRNLAIDLRDGVRLTKVMEIILLRDDMTCQMRAPAISRTQRLFNVGVALKALENADFVLSGKITAADIADGHREKTLSLLWQIIYRFRAPKFNAAATVIQTWWRKNWLNVCIRRKIKEKIEHKRRLSAVTIIQKCTRRWLQRRKIQKELNSTIIIQRWYRHHKQLQLDRKKFVRFRVNTIIIQRWYRKHLIVRRLENLVPFIREIQEEFKRTLKSVIIIQRRYQAHRLMKKVRTEYTTTRESVILIQRRWRSTLQMRKDQKIYLDTRSKVICIQQWFRSLKFMKMKKEHFAKTRQSAIAIQQWFRAHKIGAKERKKYLELKKSTVTIQKRFVANMEMRKQRQMYLYTREVIVKFQHRYRAIMLMREQRMEFIRIRKSVSIIQKHLRATIEMRKVRQEYLIKKEAALIIQSRLRAHFEATRCRQEFIRYRCAVMVIQSRYRELKMMQVQRAEFLNIKEKAIQIQTQRRALITMRQQRFEYQNLRENVIKVQQRFRANRLMAQVRSDYQKLMIAVITVQRKFRALLLMRKVRQNYEQVLIATIVIQIRFRAHLLQKKDRSRFVSMKQAAIVIQQRFRAHQSMLKVRHEFGVAKSSSILIQRWFRAYLLQRERRRNYLKMKQSALVIQRHFRAQKAMESDQCLFQMIREKAIVIQRWFRAVSLMRIEQENYQRKRGSAICLQRYVRATLQMRRVRAEYLLMKSKAICIQNHLLAFIKMRHEREQYVIKRESIIKIQRYFRGYLRMKKDRKYFTELHSAAVAIQRYFRANREMERVRFEYLLLREKTIIIQRKWRACLLTRKISNQYQLVRSLTICIQRKFRAQKTMEIERNAFLCQRWACIVIQRAYRVRQARRNQKRLEQLTISLQAQIRGHLARKRLAAMMTSEFIEARRKIKATRLIQKIWRGYRVRKNCSAKLKMIREKTKKLLLNVTEQKQIRTRIIGIIRFLKHRFDINDSLGILQELEMLSLTVPYALKADAKFISEFCHSIMSQAIRSEPDKIIISLCCRILLNLARYKPTQNDVFEINNFETIAQLLSRWCDKDCDIFQVICTLLWVFIQDPDINKAIRDFMVTHEALFLLRESKKLIERKERMRSINPHPRMPILTPREKRILPMLETNFGMKTANKNYIFNSLVFGFETILRKLSIKL